MYIKALEQEVLRLKDTFAESTRERDKIQQENLRLKALLSQHGISYDFGDSPVKFQRENSGYERENSGYSSGSISGSYRPASDSTGFSPPPPSGIPNQVHAAHMHQQQAVAMPMDNAMSQLPSNRLDYDQIGIDFVLTYDSQGRPMQIPAPYPSPPPQQV